MNNTRNIVLIIVLVVVVAGVAWYVMQGNAASTGSAQEQGAAAAAAESKNISLSSNPAVVAKGAKASLVWTTLGFASCWMQGPALDSLGALPAKGSLSTQILTATSVYRLTCQYSDGRFEAKTISVIVR